MAFLEIEFADGDASETLRPMSYPPLQKELSVKTKRWRALAILIGLSVAASAQTRVPVAGAPLLRIADARLTSSDQRPERSTSARTSKAEPLKPTVIAGKADSGVTQVIEPPSSASASEELGKQEVRWSWSGGGCFPNGLGSNHPCPIVTDIEGFRVYAAEGGVAFTATPNQRYASLGGRSSKCYLITAFKGTLESPPSPPACVDAPKPPLYKTSGAIPAPANLRATQDAKECAAATGGGFMGPICDAALKSNAQILLWDHPGTGIDGFRIYDTMNHTTPFVVDTKPNAKLRLYAVQPSKIAISDYCFTVRAFKGDTESLPSNAVCVTPKGPVPPPVKPTVDVPPSSGLVSRGVESLKNQNSGCPFAKQHADVRAVDPLAPVFSVYWIHRDANILCGDRRVAWQEAGVEFSMSDVPSDFKKVELRFTANGTVAKEGTEGGFLGTFGNKPTFNKNCIKSIDAYEFIIKDNASDPDRYGDPNAFFGWHTLATITTQTSANTTHRFDVTELVKKSLAKKQKRLGFAWRVDHSMVGDNDMCTAAFQDVALEFH